MPDNGKKTYQEFAKTIKAKYPEYKDVDDHDLATKMVEKYPEYKDQVTFDNPVEKKKTLPNTQSISPSANGISESGIGASAQQNPQTYAGQTLPPTMKLGPDGIPIVTNTAEATPQLQQPIIAAPTTQETNPVDQKNIDQELVKKGLKGSDLSESFQRGVASLASSITKTPSFLYDVGSTISKSLGIPALNSEELKQKLNLPDNVLAQDLDAAVNNSRADFEKKYDKDVSQYFSNGEYQKGFEKMSNLIAESAPTSIALMAGNAAGLSGTGSTMAGTAVFGAQKKSEMDQDPSLQGLSNEAKTTTALVNGFAEGLFEQFGVTKLGGAISGLLKGKTKEQILNIAKESFLKTYGKVAARFLGTQAEESLGEAATQFAQNAADKYIGGHPELDLSTGVKDAFLVGLGSAAAFGAPVTALDVAKTSSARSKAKEISSQKQTIDNDLKSPEVSDDVKASLSNKIKDLNEEESKISVDEKKKFNDLPDDKKQDVSAVIDKNNKIEQTLSDPSVSDETREILQKDIESNDKEIDKIYEESSAQKQKASEEQEKQEQEDVSGEIEYLKGIQESGIGLSEEESTRLQQLEKGVATPVNPEQEPPSAEKTDQVKSVEDKINENKKKFFGDQIPYIEYRKTNDALHKELSDMTNPTYFQDKVKSENRNLPEDQKTIESNFAKDLDENYDQRKKEYIEKNGNVFDTDRARELSPEYVNNPTLSQAVHVPAREFVTRVYKEELHKPAPEGKSNTVSFTAGGSGTGKSAMVNKASKIKSQLIVDTNLSHFDNAKSDIDEALQAGKKVKIHFIYRNPVQAFIEGVMGGKNRGGRTVPVDVAINANKGSLETIKQLAEHYKDNKNIKIDYFNNTGTKGKAKLFSLDDVKGIKVDYNKAKEEIQNEIERQYQDGKLTDDQYRGFSGKSELPARTDVGRGVSEGSGTGNEGSVSNTELADRSGLKTKKSDKNATKKRNVTESDQQQHSQGDIGGETAKTSDRNSNEQSGQVKEKITPENKTNGEETKNQTENQSKKTPSVLKQELTDEEEVADSERKEDAPTLQKMNDDLEVMKGFDKKDLAEKKFKGMIERAWKAKEDGKIKKTSYTAFRNKANDILGGKLNLDKEELKFKSTAIFEGIKKKLLGEGYTKILLSSPGPITPKTIADLLDLTNRLIHRGIDAGFTISEAATKALAAIKKHPTYKKLLKSGELVEKDFEKVINESVVEKNPEVPKTENQDIFGEQKVKKTAKRLSESEDFQDVVDNMEKEESFYQSINIKKATKFIDETLDQFEKSNSLEQLAQESLKDNSPFHPKIKPLAEFKLADRLRSLAQKEGGEMQKNGLNKLAADIMALRNHNINISATQTALEVEVAKMLPLSEEGLRDYTEATMGQVQNTYLSETQKKDIANYTTDINALIESAEGQKAIREAVESELDRVAEQTKGKEWVSKVNTLDELKIDLSDC